MANDRRKAARRAKYRTGLLRPPRVLPAPRRATRRIRAPSRGRHGRRIGIPFSVADPQLAEGARPGEAPEGTARRLAEAKSLAVAHRYRDALIIGCDQVAVGNGEVLGKPGTRENAVRQLRALSGSEAVFYTAVCVHNTSVGTSRIRVVPCRVTFRRLDDGTIDRYLAREQPYDCAGSAKAEGLGIALIAKMEGD